MKKLSAIKLAKILVELTKDSKNKEQTVANIGMFADYLRQKRALKLLPAIMESFRKQYDVCHETLSLHLRFARRPSQEELSDITAIIKKSSQGKSLALTAETDPSLLGGFEMHYQDTILKASLKNKIQNLRQHIAERE